jgi:hypothetical protein
MVRVIMLLVLLSSTVQAGKKIDKNEVNASYHKEVCTLVLKKLKSSFESLRTGKITDSKTAKVANLLQSYRLLNCVDEKQLIDVLACTNSQVMFFDDCRKLRLE